MTMGGPARTTGPPPKGFSLRPCASAREWFFGFLRSRQPVSSRRAAEPAESVKGFLAR